VDEGSCDEHAGAEVSREEQKLVGDGNLGESLDDDGEGTSCLLSVYIYVSRRWTNTYRQCSARG
jgi:hypothetical protein